tara:strand:+ start:3480 stop:5543 length:2064 start_codon:yes stop_codon:yes gene_type:complete
MADLNKTIKIILKGESDKLNKSIGSANASFAKFAKGAAAAGAAIVAVGSAIFKMNQKVANMVNLLSDAQSKTGINISTLQGLKLAAEGSGRSFESIEGGLIRFQSAINMASQGTGRQAEAFQKLGVQVTNADGSLRDANSVFNDSIQALSDMGEGIDRNSTAIDLFGRTAGAALIQSGAITNMEAFNERVAEFGLKTGPAAREEAAKWQRAMADMRMVIERAIQDIVAYLTGGGSLSEAVVKATGKFIFMKTVVGDVMRAIGAVMKSVIGSVTSVALALGQIKFEKITSAVTTLGKGVAGIAAGKVLSPDTWVNLAQGFKKMNAINQEVGRVAGKLSAAVNVETADAIDKLGNTLGRAEAASKRFIKGASLGGGRVTGAGGKGGAGGGGAGGEDGGAGGAAAAAAKEAETLKRLQQEVDAIISKNAEKHLTEEQKITKEYQAQIDRLKKITEESKGKINTTIEQAKIEKDMQNEIFELRKSNEEKLMELQRTAQQELMQGNQEIILSMIDGMKNYGLTATGWLSDWGSAVTTIMKNNGSLVGKQARRMHALNQAAQIGDILVNKASAVFANYAKFGPGLGTILNAPLIALAAAQITAIKSTPPPKFHQGGVVQGPDVVNANLLRGEMVLDRATTQRIGGPSGVQNLGQPKIIIANPFKHFDRFTAASMRGDSRIRELVESPSGRRGF